MSSRIVERIEERSQVGYDHAERQRWVFDTYEEIDEEYHERWPKAAEDRRWIRPRLEVR